MLLKKTFTATVLLTTAFFFWGCEPWNSASNWKEVSLISFVGNNYIQKTEGTIERESKSSIAGVKNIVHDIGGKQTMHDYTRVLEQCVEYTHSKFSEFNRLKIKMGEDVIQHSIYAGDLNPTPQLQGGKFAQGLNKFAQTVNEVNEKSMDRAGKLSVGVSNYKIVSDSMAFTIKESLQSDAVISLNPTYKYDLKGIGTAGYALGVVELTVHLYYTNAKGARVTSILNYSGVSDNKTDVKAGGFFQGETMEPLLLDAFKKALDSFIQQCNKELGSAA